MSDDSKWTVGIGLLVLAALAMLTTELATVRAELREIRVEMGIAETTAEGEDDSRHQATAPAS